MTIGVVNTHVHVPPNFSAFSTVEDVIESAGREETLALGISNFFDQQVYGRFRDLADEAGIVPLYGLEFITLIEDLAQEGIRVNDPANPGRMYLCGKGIAPFKEKSERAAAIATAIRVGNDQRANEMVDRIADRFLACGVDTGLTAPAIAATVAERAGVPTSWVSLQERHIAMAFADVVQSAPVAEREELLNLVYGSATRVDVTDAVALQGEIRSRLMKAGTSGFVAEVPLSFDDAYAYVLEMDGIPTYPTLADGVDPACPFEDPADALAASLLARGIYAAELIPIRNTAACVDAYVKAFTEAGIIVMAGTEHNTLDRIPIAVACVDGPVSETSRRSFWEATCVVAAHQHEVAAGRPGYVDSRGALIGTDPALRRAELIELGARLIEKA